MKTRMKLTITLEDGPEITLSEDEAKELYAKLGELFGSDTHYVPVPYQKPYIPHVPGPIWIGPNTDTPIWDKPTITNGGEITFNGDPDSYVSVRLEAE
jgi:hypothetical protein